jgi:hypothetical protein
VGSIPIARYAEEAHGKLSVGLERSVERANEINNSFVLWANPLL